MPPMHSTELTAKPHLGTLTLFGMNGRKEIHEKPKLSMMKQIMECEVKSTCAFLKSKAEKRRMLKLKGGTATFQIEMGMWHELKREEWVCKECDSGEVG